MKQRIIVREVQTPKEDSLNHAIRWVCDSFDFVSGRDIEDTSFKILYDLLEQFSTHQIVSTEMLAESLNMETPRINHHLRNFMESGIVFREKRQVALRGGSLSSAVIEMKRDSDRMFARVLEVARKIDREIGLV